ncbi:MAG TPA: DegV family protein [Candidatus Limnocylindrales bacterium]|nr:DegV family protein [Candidatus Limnocylindrales bacterium]
MPTVAIVTDSASDLAPARAAELRITVVPLLVSFGSEEFQAGVGLSAEDFWARMTAPDAPFPKTAAASPAAFRDAFEAQFAAGADSVVCITVAASLSAAFKSATLGREMLPEREIHVIDSDTAAFGQALLAILGRDLAAAGRSAAEVAAEVRRRAPDVEAIVCLDTLEYLRRGGRISGPQAVLGTLLSVKPIIAIHNGKVDKIDQVRTRGKARERAIEYVASRPVERLAVFHCISPDLEEFRSAVIARVGTVPADQVETAIVGPSIGPHLGPGAVGAAMLYREA